MRDVIFLKFFVVAVSALACGCAGPVSLVSDETTAPQCGVEMNVIQRHGRQGLQMTNHCRSCLAVAFEFQDTKNSKPVETACYVPSQTRVVYWQAPDHRLLQQRSCAQVTKSGHIGNVAVEMLSDNYRNTRCEIVGVFAD